jgi:hypothetical protein
MIKGHDSKFDKAFLNFIMHRLDDRIFGANTPDVKEALEEYHKEFDKINSLLSFEVISQFESSETNLRNRQMEYAYRLGISDAIKFGNFDSPSITNNNLFNAYPVTSAQLSREIQEVFNDEVLNAISDYDLPPEDILALMMGAVKEYAAGYESRHGSDKNNQEGVI